MWNVFSIFDVKYSIKELLHEPSETQWILHGKLKRKLLYPTRYYPLKTQQHEILLFWGVLWGPGNQKGIQWFFYDFMNFLKVSVCLLFKSSFNFKLGFCTSFEYISGVSSEKTFYV